MVAVITVAGSLLQTLPFYNPYDTNMLYILCVAISAAYLGFGPSILASILSVLTFDFFFIAPTLTFIVGSNQGIVSLLILSVVTIVISCLSPQIRK
jgi:two-component system, OmpR family, sensor histidine kinase KdpD